MESFLSVGLKVLYTKFALKFFRLKFGDSLLTDYYGH